MNEIQCTPSNSPRHVEYVCELTSIAATYFMKSLFLLFIAVKIEQRTDSTSLVAFTTPLAYEWILIAPATHVSSVLQHTISDTLYDDF